MHATQILRMAAALVAAWLLGLPALAQDAKEATKLVLHIEATAQANPDASGRPSPAKVRVYELQDSASFAEADYFSLNSNDKSVLGNDLLARDEFILRPGESRKIERRGNPKTQAIGLLVGYYDLNATWRVIQPLPAAPEAAWYRALLPSNKLELSIQLQPQGIVIVPAR